MNAVAMLINEDLVKGGLCLLLSYLIQRDKHTLQNLLEMDFGQDARPVRNN